MIDQIKLDCKSNVKSKSKSSVEKIIEGIKQLKSKILNNSDKIKDLIIENRRLLEIEIKNLENSRLLEIEIKNVQNLRKKNTWRRLRI